MKRLGVGLGMDPATKAMSFYVHRPSRAEDAIWEAVQAAIDEGMTPQRFRIEAAQAWEEILSDAGKCAAKDIAG